MLFLKKLFLGSFALGLIFLGGNGTQSSNLLMQGGGFVGIIVGFVVLYIFGKLVWRAMGCLPSLLIICGVICFVLYAVGAFNDGVGNVWGNIQSFLGQRQTQGFAQQQNAAPQLTEPAAPAISENFGDVMIDSAPTSEMPQAPTTAIHPTPPEQAPSQQPAMIEAESGLAKLVSSLTGGAVGAKQAHLQADGGFNPNNYPAVNGIAKVINGDTIELRGRYLKLFGVAAPISNQTCANARGRSYACGQESARWLKSWISGHELECRVVQQDSRGNMIGTCALGQYDVGAALVNAGWAVANIGITDIYVPYEMQAQQNQRGLWQGQFYMPWDWVEIKSKKPKIKVIQPKRPKKSILDF